MYPTVSPKERSRYAFGAEPLLKPCNIRGRTVLWLQQERKPTFSCKDGVLRYDFVEGRQSSFGFSVPLSLGQ